ncbi:MAG: stage III sporulation protein AC [Clostridiales bacterium]|nr:stage III sporulation protein AC [Clostridiales bacterium]
MVQIDAIFKLAGLGIAVAFVSMVLNRAGREEVGTLVTVVGLVIALFVAVNVISELFGSLKNVFSLY